MPRSRRVHINYRGEADYCRARQGRCPLKLGDKRHFDSIEEARNYYEQNMRESGNLFPTVSRKNMNTTLNNLAQMEQVKSNGNNSRKPPNRKQDKQRALKKKKFRKMMGRFTKVGAGLAIASIALNACSPIVNNTVSSADPYDPSSKSLETKVEEITGKDVKDSVNEATNGITSWLNDNADVDELPSIDEAEEALSSILGGSGSAESTGAPSSSYSGDGTDLSSITFQGRPIEPSQAEIEDAQQRLNEIPVMNEIPEYEDNYDRSKMFGSNPEKTYSETEVTDFGNNPNVMMSSGSNPRAVGGSFIDPYTGLETPIMKDDGDRNTNLEHIVALHEIYQSDPMGVLTAEERYQIANDPMNLTTVDWRVNQQEKSDKDAAEYLPTVDNSDQLSVASWDARQCTFVIQSIMVKSEYGLTVDNAEKGAMQQVIDDRCY